MNEKDDSTELKQLKQKLEETLKVEPVDNDLLISLAHQIAELENNKIRISVDAGVIDRLGQELVARQETAVSELVKNAYDADSTTVTLSFIETDKVGGTLIIDDNGDGMTRDELVSGFMRISSTSKLHTPYSKKFNRRRAGQKGIGRFAVQRLGAYLTVITSVQENSEELILEIDWNDYHNDQNIYSISNTLNTSEKRKDKGTTLIISGLRDKWSKAAIKRVYRYLTNIIQPYSIGDIARSSTEDVSIENNSSPKTKELCSEDNIDPGMQIELYKDDEKVADKNTMLFDHAAAVIEGYIDPNGQGIYSVVSSKLDIDEIGEIGDSPEDSTVPFTKLRDIKFRAHYFLYAPAGIIPKTQEASIRKLARKEGGIRLYRNGFRVLPYGEPGDDWLKLDESEAKRTLLAPHGNNNFFGLIEMKDYENLYNETSSREGLIENSALIQLKNFVYRTLISGVLKVASVRKTKVVTSQQKNDDGHWEDIEVTINNIAKSLEELDRELEQEESGSNVETKRKRRKRVKKVQEQIEQVKEIQQKLLKERAMLRVLSSIGLNVSQFIHEIKYYMDNMQSDIRFISSIMTDNSECSKRLDVLGKNFTTFKTYTSYFNSVVSQNVTRELAPINLKHTVNTFIETMAEDALRSGIKFIAPKFNNLLILSKPMHPSEWSSVLFNFYTNSKKAIKRAHESYGKLFIECGVEDDLIYLEFSDNGDGISPDIENRVFDEFFTTTSPQNYDDTDENTEIQGTGLGLKIVKDIANSYRGNVEVVPPKSDYSTTIRFEIKAATDKDLEKYDS